MKHVIICREFRPSPDPPGGIGTYVGYLARMLAESGEIVHVVAQRWEGAPAKLTESCGGRLIVHRLSLDDAVRPDTRRNSSEARLLGGLVRSDCPSQAFSWQVAHLTERLVNEEGIDLIEGSEWEAPLYYFQLRRALGLGPRHQPPCLVHLHSPSELIFRYNQWDTTLSDYEPRRRLEEYTVRSADAILCPSRYLARQAESLFRLSPNQVHVIPYPAGDVTGIKRAPEVWRRDSICYAGRLELRKGVAEWVDAAVKVAGARPGVEFDFIGGDTSLDGGPGRSVRDYLDDRIPRSLQSRFRFHGSITRERLIEIFAKTPIAVVPSRWENLPYSCIEAMCTGLPVLVTPTGGMTELITDGESGWVAPDATSAGLALALGRILETPSARRAEMGRNAEEAARRICSNEAVLNLHMEWRKGLVEAGAKLSLEVPASKVPAAPRNPSQGMAVVINGVDHPELLAGCLESVRSQTQAALAVVVVGDQNNTRDGVKPDVEFLPARTPFEIRDAALRRILQLTPSIRGIVFLNGTVRLQAQYLSVCESVLERHPGVGLVSSFVQYEGSEGGLDATPGAGECWKLSDLDRMACVAVRTESLQVPGAENGPGIALEYPEILAWSVSPANKTNTSGFRNRKRSSAMALAQRGSAQLALNSLLTAPWKEKVRCLGRILKQPQRTARWLAWHLRAAAMRTR